VSDASRADRQHMLPLTAYPEPAEYANSVADARQRARQIPMWAAMLDGVPQQAPGSA
jgi:hypothetical protein